MNLYRIAYSSSLIYCSDLRSFVRTIGRIEGYSEHFLSQLELSAHEAYVNAVRHGNEENPDFIVSIIFRCGETVSGRTLQVQVADCGKGFDLMALDNSFDEESETALGGRGVRFIRHYTERIDIEASSEGSMLTLHYIPF
ncbi:MAG TPA: ATP-binding protein [Chlorobaculum sp.]|jgi:anti-sigma regulatory factor (Ser/Thr protein kinase)|nr:ATP-binding protein [Chlorobaculum sp.]